MDSDSIEPIVICIVLNGTSAIAATPRIYCSYRKYPSIIISPPIIVAMIYAIVSGFFHDSPIIRTSDIIDTIIHIMFERLRVIPMLESIPRDISAAPR